MPSLTFFDRPASTVWEPLPIPGVEGVNCWIWYQPDHLPNGAVVNIPPELCGQPGGPLPFSLLHLIQGLGLPWESLAAVSLFGSAWQPVTAWHAVAGHPLPMPVDASQTQIMLMTQQGASLDVAPVTVVPPTGSTEPPASETGSSTNVAGQFGRLEADWKACLGIERQLTGMRKQLSGVLGRLNSLDRDLRPDESLGADRESKDQWQDARRWVRESASKVSRCIKAHDIGVTSGPGRRNMILAIYEQAAEQADAAGDLSQSRHEIEVYRRELMNLFNNMTSALQGANTNGVQRAQRVLSKISAQNRQKRSRDRGKS